MEILKIMTASHRDNAQSSLLFQSNDSKNQICRMSPFGDHFNVSGKSPVNTFVEGLETIPGVLNAVIGCDHLALCSDGLVDHMGKIPFPEIPKELRKTLSDTMFGPSKTILHCEVVIRDSKHSNTHTKKSHIVRYEAINQQCMMCKKAFSRPCALKTHIYTHTGEKPYCCPIKDCTHRFSVRSNLRRHTSTMHPTI